MREEDRRKGFYQKYKVEKADGTPVDPEAVYFVLRLDDCRHARAGVMAYAKRIRNLNPELAADIEKLIDQFGGV